MSDEKDEAPERDNDLITVCDKCLCATCWQGTFMCDEAQMAGTIQLTRAELRKRNNYEHPSHWLTDEQIAQGGIPKRFKTPI